MTLFDEGKIIIRVAVNEMQPKSINAHIPYGAEEVAAEAVACAQAGASIVHFHSRTDDGAQAVDDDSNGAGIYRQALELTARDSDIIMEPTNLPRGHDPSLAVDVPHIWSLVEAPPAGTRLEVVNIDGFRFDHQRTAWDESEQRLLAIRNRRLDRETPFAGPEVIRETIKCGLVPFFGLFDLADVRMLSAFARTGIVPQPVLVQINFFFDLIRGPTPSVAALDAFLAEWRRVEVDSELCLFVRAMPDRASYEHLFEAAIDRGVHIRVGLGDNPHLFPNGRSVDMVEHAIEMASSKGLKPATPADLRARVRI
jgi:3-keto-5-aminohexanoate cleavage enzyme